MPKYPAQIDNAISLPTVVDNLTPVQGAIFNKLRDTVIAIEAELGTNPSGTAGTVKGRISLLESAVGNIQASVKLGQDLGNTLSHPFVIGIQGRPVSPDAPILNQVLGWNGMTWAPQNPSGATGPTGDTGPTGPTGPSGIGGTLIGDANGPLVSNTVDKLKGKDLAASVGTVDATQDGYSLVWDNTSGNWHPALVSSGSNTLGGDATGPIGSNTVSKIHGTAVTTAGGALTTGKVLRVTGVATSDWGAVDLANTNAITGILPTVNQASQTMGGDVSGTTAASVVTKVRGNAYKSETPGASQDGYVPTWVNANNQFEIKPTTTPSVTLAGDVTGASGANTVVKINGASVTTIGSANTVLGTTNGTSLSYFQIINAQISSSAAIVYSKLSLSNSILNADINTTAAINKSKLENSAALSVVGRSTNSTGALADISATAASDAVLRESGSTVGFGTIATGGITNNAVTDAKLRQGGALTVVGRSANSTGNVADITATNNQVLRVSGSVLGFGAIDLSTAQVTGILPTGNQAAQTLTGDVGGTTAATVIGTNKVLDTMLRQGGALTVMGRSANSTGNVADIAGANNQVLRISGSVLGFGAIDLSTAQVTGLLPTGNQVSQNMAGDVTGTTSANTVVNINGSPVTTIGTTNTVLGTTDGSNITYFQIANAQVSSSAAITYSKLSLSNSILDADINASAAIVVSKLANSTALSVLGRSANSTGAHADISGTNNQVLRVSGSVLGFGAIDLSTAQVTGVLPTGNQANQTMAGDVTGTTATSTVVNINGSPVSTIGVSNTVLGTTDGTSITYFQVANAQVSSSAAINKSKLENSAALSVVGRSANSTGTLADISATAASGAVLRESGSVIGFGTVETAGITNNAITDAKLRQGGSLSVIGRSANSTGNVADISGVDNQVLIISGSVLGFGAVDLSTAQVTGLLPTGNQAAQTMGGDISGTTAASVVNKLKGTALATSVGTVGVTQDGYSLVWDNGSSTWKPTLISAGTGGTLIGDVTGPEGSNTVVKIRGVDLATSVGTVGATQDGYSLVYVDSHSAWEPVLVSTGGGGSLGGDVTGPVGSNTVVKINGSSVTTIGSANTVLGTTDGTSITYFQIADAQVSSSAAIAYSKLNLTTSIVNNDVSTSAAIAVSKLANSTALSVLGRTANSTGAHADIAGADNQVLRISGSVLGFGAIDLSTAQVTGILPAGNQAAQTMGGDVTGTTAASVVVNINGSPVATIGSANTVLGTTDGSNITYFQVGNAQISSSAGIAVSKLANGAAISVLGRSANSSGVHADISGTDNQVLRISGSVLGFGAVDLSTAQVTGVLPAGNQAAQTMGGDVSGTTAASVVDKLKGTALAASVGTVGVAQDGYALVWDNGSSNWKPAPTGGGSSLSGDVTGTTSANTVVKINGSSVTTIGSANTVLGTTDGTSITYFQVANAQVSSSAAIAVSKLANSTALSVLGRTANSTGAHADIAGADNQVLRISGSTLGFGAIDLSTAQVTGVLPDGNQAAQTMSGDVSGTTAASVVDKLKGKALAASVGTVGATQDGYSLVWDNGSSTWKPAPAGTSITPGSSPGQTLVWNGSAYVPAFYLQDDVLPPYEFQIDETTSDIVQVGETFTQGFHVNFDTLPSSAILTDDGGGPSKDVLPELTIDGYCTSDNPYVKTTFGDIVTYTITAVNGHNTKLTTAEVIWGLPSFYGVGAAGQTGSSFIFGLDGYIDSVQMLLSFPVSAGPTEKVYFACRSAYGDVTFTVYNIEGGFTKTQANVSLTSVDNGWTEDYDLYESNNLGLGSLVIFADNDGN